MDHPPSSPLLPSPSPTRARVNPGFPPSTDRRSDFTYHAAKTVTRKASVCAPDPSCGGLEVFQSFVNDQLLRLHQNQKGICSLPIACLLSPGASSVPTNRDRPAVTARMPNSANLNGKKVGEIPWPRLKMTLICTYFPVFLVKTALEGRSRIFGKHTSG